MHSVPFFQCTACTFVQNVATATVYSPGAPRPSRAVQHGFPAGLGPPSQPRLLTTCLIRTASLPSPPTPRPLHCSGGGAAYFTLSPYIYFTSSNFTANLAPARYPLSNLYLTSIWPLSSPYLTSI